jgi:micrococcal nuclease
MARPVVLTVLMLLAAAVPPAGAGPLDTLQPGERAIVARVPDGDSVILDGGVEVRLAGIRAPQLGRDGGAAAEPFAEEARDALASLALGQAVELRYGGLRRDRYGRALAYPLIEATGVWLQGELLARGLARVDSYVDNRALVTEMLAIERAARAARRGLWSDRYYRVRNPSETWSDLDSFQIVEGRVVAAAEVKGVGYLNFGPDWRTDFTFSLDRAALRLFRKAGVDIQSLAGRRVRGRGWLRPRNGPLIELTHPEQIELLDE